MTDDEELGDELEQLIEDYVEGLLDSGRAQQLLSLLETSPEARARLASAVATERLLHTLGRGPVPADRIMAAVTAHVGRPAPRLVRASRLRGLAGAVAALALLALAAAFFLRPPSVTKTAHSPAPAPLPPTVAHQPVDKPPASIAQEPRPEPAPADAPAEPPPTLRAALPFDLPPPPADVAEAPPGDGRGEPGYAEPPAEWADASAEPGDEPDATGARDRPAPPLLWVALSLPDADPSPELDALSRALEQRLGLRYGWAVRTMDEVVADPAANPVLLVATHHRFAFTQAQRARMRRYLLSGGLIVFNATAGSAPAYDSARRELRLLLPEAPIERLSEDHPIYQAYYNTPDENLPGLESATIACRTVAVLSRRDLAAGWSGHRGDVRAVLAPEEAVRLGVNLSSYATTVRGWARQAAAMAVFPTDARPDAGRVFLAQVEYDGEWRTRFAALPLLLHSFNQRTEVPVKLGIRTMRLSDPALFNAPLVYLTGHEPLRVTAPEAQALKRYLESGGFLFAEACCGRRGFDRSFRALMAGLFPDRPLEPIPADSVLFRAPNRMAELSVTPALAAQLQAMTIRPRLEGLQTGGSYFVVYSPLGLAGAWEASPLPYAFGYDDPSALKLGQNILLHAVTQ